MATNTGYIEYNEQTVPSSPAASKQRLYIDSADHKLKRVNSSGTVVPIEGGSTAPGYVFDYTEFTSAVNVTATTEGTANSVVAGSSVSYDGSTAVWIEFWAPYVQNAAGNTNCVFVLLEDSTVLGISIVTQEGASNNQRSVAHILRKRTPSNASHTYTVKAYTSSGTAVVGAGSGGSGAYLPGFLSIRRY